MIQISTFSLKEIQKPHQAEFKTTATIVYFFGVTHQRPAPTMAVTGSTHTLIGFKIPGNNPVIKYTPRLTYKTT